MTDLLNTCCTSIDRLTGHEGLRSSMLIQYDVEHRQVDARLPKRLADMNIRDLIKPEATTNTELESLSPRSNRMQSMTNGSSFTSSISLPPLPAPHQLLPSPSDPSKYSHGSALGPSTQTTYHSHSAQQPFSTHLHLQNGAYQPGQLQQPQPGRYPNEYGPNKRPSPPDDSRSDHRSGPPPKRQSKWNPEEDRKIIAYRGQGMKWSEISARLYPRTEIGCRLHYQNYLEKRSEWDEEKKNKLARVYERVKEDMWKLVANEMKIPWRSAEGMHWIMGETEMARRANVTPFSNTIQSSTTSSTTATVYGSASANGNGHHLPPVYLDGSNTVVFDTEQLAVLNGAAMPPGTCVTNGPVSTFTSVTGIPRESRGSTGNIQAAPSMTYAAVSDHALNDQQHSRQAHEDPLKLSPRSNRAVRDISTRTHQSMREKGVLLPGVSEMEGMVPASSSAPSSVAGERRKDSEDRSVSGHSSNEGKSEARKKDKKGKEGSD